MNSTHSDIMSTLTPDVGPTHQAPRKGKGAKKVEEARFRQRKNKSYGDSLLDSAFVRLKIIDPTTLGSIQIVSNVVPSRIPVSLRGIPRLLEEVWQRMNAIGSKPFAKLATDENKAIFFKVCLLIFETKVCYAQRTVESSRMDLQTQYEFSEMTLRHIKSVSDRLPAPIAIALENLGRFSDSDQHITPVFATTQPAVASGAVNFTRSGIRTIVRALANRVPVNEVVYEIAKHLEELPVVSWLPELDQTICLSPRTVAFWAGGDEWDPLPANERVVFLKMMSALESSKGFLLHVDLSHGEGTAVQAVRFHEEYDPEQTETLYYSQIKVSEFEEQLAPALLFGFEYQIEKYSRFCGNFDEPLVQGSASQTEARRSLVWANKD